MRTWLNGAGKVLSNVAEVVAPTPKTPLEAFRNHWLSIRDFYIDQKNDVESGNIPTHLHGLVQILLTEDDERLPNEGAGPCIEYFMQNKIMETLCALCLIDRPTGVRRLILGAVNSILGNMRVLLVPHMSIHQPLANLISGMATMQMASEVVDALALIKTCLNLIAADPMLGEFFIVVPPDGRTQAEYALWSALLSLFKRTAPEQRERIEELLLYCVNVANERVMVAVVATDFASRLAEELLGLFAQLPQSIHNTRNIESEQVYRYKLHLRFCNTLTSEHAGLTNVPNPFSDSLLLALEEIFIEKALIPSLVNEGSGTLVRDTLIAKESLQLCSGPLQDTFIALSVGLQAQPLRDALCARIMSPDAALSMATMRFFDVVCGLYHPHATDSLMLSHIKTRPAPQQAVNDNPDCTFEPILNSFPANYTQDRASSSSLDGYTLHARGILAQVSSAHAALGIPSDHDRAWAAPDRASGPFLEAVFHKLRSLPSLSLRHSLLVTSLVSRTLTYPSRPLFEIVARLTLEAVAAISAELESQVKAYRLRDDAVTAAINKAWMTLSTLRDLDLSEKMAPQDEAALFQRVVVLDEFVREVVAIDSARNVFEIESQ